VMVMIGRLGIGWLFTGVRMLSCDIMKAYGIQRLVDDGRVWRRQYRYVDSGD